MIYVDLDGVLNDYPISYLDFLREDQRQIFTTLDRAKNFFNYSSYIKLREKYRNKIEPSLPCNQEVVSLLNNLGSSEEILIVSKRPLNSITHLRNTFSFLKRSGLKYDSIVYWNKNLKDLNIPFEIRYCKIAIEDNFKIADFLSREFDMRTFVLLNENNRDYREYYDNSKIKYGVEEDLKKFLKESI